MRPHPYTVKINGQTVAGFTEVAGLTTDSNVVDYREGDDPGPSTRKPPRNQFNTVTLSRGVVQDPSFSNWLHHAGARRHLTIEHHDIGGRVLWSRTLMDCAITEHRSNGPSAIEKITLTFHHQRPS